MQALGFIEVWYGLCHNSGVRTRITKTWVLTLVLMLFSALVQPAQAMWQCEGKSCGKTPWFCCCESPKDAQDENCNKTTKQAKNPGKCPSDCGCTLTIQTGDAATFSTVSSQSVSYFYPVVLPQAPVVAPVALNLVARAIETRGPPPSSVSLSCAPLRAPPAA